MISISQWMPGVVDQVTESSTHESAAPDNLAERLAREAQKSLDKSEHRATEKDKMLSSMTSGITPISENGASAPQRTRKKRVRIVSTPAGGGDMFGGEEAIFQPKGAVRGRNRRSKTMSTPLSGDMWGEENTVVLSPGEVLVHVIGPNDKKYSAKMKEGTLKLISEAESPILLSGGEEDREFVGQYLDGFVRRTGRRKSISSKSLEGLREEP